MFTVGERRTIRVFIMAVKPSRSSEDREQAFAHHVDRLAEFETPETKACPRCACRPHLSVIE